MNKKISATLAMASLTIFTVPEAHADASCLVGTWESQEESFTTTAEVRQVLGLDLTASGGLTIEFIAPYRARLIYKDYVILRTMKRSTHTVTMEMTFNGTIDGGFSVYEEKSTVSIMANDEEVHVSVRQKRPSMDWMPLGEDEERAPHRQDSFAFVCSDDELILTKSEHGQFGAEYRGRFVRAD